VTAAGGPADVLTTVADGVATVTLNRPGSRNALSSGLLSALRATLTELDGRPDIAAIVLTGADPAFCAGLDLKELSRAAAHSPQARWTAAAPAERTADRGGQRPRNTGGLEIALACHFVIASDRARFADTHVRIGIMPG
jgi:enoyl-CoA hydratase